jgi:hypothetical protein
MQTLLEKLSHASKIPNSGTKDIGRRTYHWVTFVIYDSEASKS